MKKKKDSFEETIFNEKNIELNKFLYNNYFKYIFPNYNTSFNHEKNFSIMTPTENILIKLKYFYSLLDITKPSKFKLNEARKSIIFYKYIKDKNSLKDYTLIPDKIEFDKENNNEDRKYLHKGIFSIFDWDKEEIGEELIRITRKLLNKIEPKELYRAICLKKDKEITSPNVVEAINYSNNLSLFIIEDIISYDSTSDRAKVIEQWAEVAEYCKSQRDYNDCFAINTAFNSYIITGLKKTIKEIKDEKIFKKITKFCKCNCNYKEVREEIKKLNQDEYFFPFLGMILRDINFFEESSKYLIEGKLINFEKIENINYILETNFGFKKKKRKVLYFHKKELQFLEYLEEYSEEYLEALAKEIEPKFIRNNGKKHFKQKTTIDETFFKDKNKGHKRLTMSMKLKHKLFGGD